MKVPLNSPLQRFLVGYAIFFVVVSIAVHRPLPPGFTKSSIDRFIMHVIEPALRVTYYWPSRIFFSTTSGMVWWTRLVLNNLSIFVGPLLDYDSVVHMETAHWEGVKVRVYWPRYNASTNGAVIFIHGGGFALGNIEMYESLTRRIARTLNSVLVSIDYRLSPETPFPGGLHDCEKVIEHFLSIAEKKYGVDPKKIVIMGDSAGGNLAAAITQRRKLAGQMQFAGQVLMYPLLQIADFQSLSYRYYQKHLEGFALVDPESVALYYMFYAGIDMDEHKDLVKYALTNGHVPQEHSGRVQEILQYDSFSHLNYSHAENGIPPRAEVKEHKLLQELMAPWITNPDFSPLMREDLSGLPPAFIMTCEFDVLRDEGIMYALRLEKAGIPVLQRNYENGFHAMLNFHNEVAEASSSLMDIISWTKEKLTS